MHDATEGVGVARAGAAFAARRTELGLSQRELAKMKIISAPALIAFEKGRVWPRDMTRAKLEQVVQWPPGPLARLSAGTQASPDVSPGVRSEEAGEILSGAVALAAGTVWAAADKLPADDAPSFPGRAQAVLADMRQLEALTARAVRSSRGAPEVIALLRETRHRYDALMARAAAAPGATLGQRLYAARTAAALSGAEAAAILDIAPEGVAAIEAEHSVSDDYRDRIEAFITDINAGRSG